MCGRLKPGVLAGLLAGLVGLTPACDDDGPSPAGCERSADCPGNAQCVQGSCVVDPGCMEEDDCAAPSETCSEAGQCVLRPGFGDQCDAGRPCGFGEFCSELLGRCFVAADSRPCSQRADCPMGQLCDREAAQCVPDVGCFGPQFCDPDEVCNPNSRICEVDDRVSCVFCSAELGCPEGSTCDEETGACVQGSPEEGCPDQTRCSPTGQCVQCQVNADCGVGLVCNSLTGRCESNLRCADSVAECPDGPGLQCQVCEAPRVCNRRSNRCEAPPTPCDDDTDCEENARCDTERAPPVCVVRPSVCLDDLLDEAGPNDSVANRTPIETGTVDELILCPGDEDWYGLQVPGGTEVTLDLRFLQADGDLELQVLLPDGQTLVAEGRTVTDNERVRFRLGTPRNLAIRVASAVPLPNTIPYRLRVTFDESEACDDDRFEENDRREDAASLSPFETRSAQLCPADPDWFRLDGVPAGSSVDLSLDFVPSLGDLDLAVFRPGQPEPLLESASRGQTESLRFSTSFGGDFLVRVEGRRTDENPYDLRAEIFEDPTATCPDDPGEPNDDPTRSSTIGMDFEGVRAICQGDEDWYRIEFPGGGGVLAVDLSALGGADFDAQLYPDVQDPLRGAPLSEGLRVGRREFFVYTGFEPEPLLLRVFGATPSDVGRYTLRTTAEASFVCQDDAADAQGLGGSVTEPFALGAAPLRSAELSLCAMDEDFVQVTLPPGFTHEVQLQWRRANLELDYSVFLPNGAPVNVSTFRPSANVVASELTVQDSPVDIVVQPVRSMMVPVPTDYRVVVDSRPVLLCDGDVFDPNETADMASRLELPVLEGNLQLCPSQNDVDVYDLGTLAAGERVEAEIRFQNGDLSLELVRADDPDVRPCETLAEPGQRCFSDGFDLTERVGYTADEDISLLLRVSSVFSSPLVPDVDGVDTLYTLEVERSEP